MNLKLLITVPVVALLALPAEVAQFFSMPAKAAQTLVVADPAAERLAAMQQVLGLTLDPHPATEMTFSVPDSFLALDRAV